MDANRIVVDTNIIFASLLRGQSRFRQIILTHGARRFYSPRFVMVELFKHKERIVTATELCEDDLLECLNAHLSSITFVEEGAIPIDTWIEGRRLCPDTDPEDAPFVTLTLHVNGLRWTADSELEASLRRKGFTQFFNP